MFAFHLGNLQIVAKIALVEQCKIINGQRVRRNRKACSILTERRVRDAKNRLKVGEIGPLDYLHVCSFIMSINLADETAEGMLAEPIEEPAVEPVAMEPAVEPVAMEPAVEPVAMEPAVEPVAMEPAVELVAMEPAVELVAMEPAVEPIESLCAVCLVNTRTVICIPCGHAQFCAPCMNNVMNLAVAEPRCPTCRGAVNMVVPFFN
jgi:hypothetical protein